MNFNINSNSLNNRPQATEGSTKANVTENIKRALVKAGLTEGSVFNGKIQDITGSSVKILLSGGDTLLATLENGASFNIGENVNFMVKENDGVRILLQSVEAFGENKLSQSLINSLEQLGLNVNDRNAAMVKEMMAYGMTLDATSLNDMERLVNAYPAEKVEDIVMLSSHGIPVTEENLHQLNAYNSCEHRITENIDNLAKELTELSESRPELVKSIVEDIIKELSGSLSEQANASVNDKLNGTINNIEISSAIPIDTEDNVNITEENHLGAIDNAVQEINEKTNEAWDNAGQLMPEDKASEGIVKDDISKQAVNTQLSSDDGMVIRHNIAEINHAEISRANNQNTQTDSKNIINQPETGQNIEKNYPAGIQTDKLQRDIKEAINELKKSWMLNADSLEGKTGEEVKKIINERLKTIYDGAEKIMDVLKNSGMEKTDTYKAAENMKNNFLFMNDFNHMASYIQVPYRTLSGEANGELFVYNRNKNKSLNDGPLTAFLHLDMEYLGATDVRVSMDISGKVSTKFTLADIVSQNIVEEHLHELKKRLEQQGYEVELTSEVTESKKTESPFEQVMKVDKPRNEIKRYGFDIRL